MINRSVQDTNNLQASQPEILLVNTNVDPSTDILKNLKTQTIQQAVNQTQITLQPSQLNIKNDEGAQNNKWSNAYIKECIQKPHKKNKLAIMLNPQQKGDLSDINMLKQKLKAYTQSSRIESTQNPQISSQKKPNEKSAHQILRELEQFHQKNNLQINQKKLHQSLSMKTKIIKLKPQKSSQKKIKNTKQAQQKIKFNIQFLQALKLNHQKEKPFFKQFLHDSQKTFKPKQKIRIKQESLKAIKWEVDNKGLKIKNSQKCRIEKVKQKVQKTLQHLNVLIESPLKLPPIQTKKSLKQKPYSIYNIYQKNNEIFTNNPSKLNWP